MMNKKLLFALGSLVGLLAGSAVVLKNKFPLFAPQIPVVDNNTVLLFQATHSPYCEKISRVMDYKGIPYQTVNILIGIHKHFVKEMSKQELVPFIKYREQIICDSTNIASFLDERFPNNSLYYEDNKELNKRVLLLEDWSDESLVPTLRNLMFLYFYENQQMAIEDSLFDVGVPLFDNNKNKFIPILLSDRMKKYRLTSHDKQALKKKARDHFDIILELLKNNKFLVGDKLTIADISVATAITIATRISYLYDDEVYESVFEWQKTIFDMTKRKSIANEIED